MFPEEQNEANTLPQIEQSVLFNQVDDEFILNGHYPNNQNQLLMNSMVLGGGFQPNETSMSDEDFPSGFINDILNAEP